MTYALDSNIISRLLRDDDTVYSRYYEALAQDNHCVIPLITYFEVKRGLEANNAGTKIRSFERLCTVLGVDDLAIEDVDVATDIYAKLKLAGLLIGDSDTLIAATCLAHGYTLVTDNTRHFERVDGLQIVNWVER